MSAEIECRKCGSDLEGWNNGGSLFINYCPYCGKQVLKKQRDVLHRKTTCGEISDIIQSQLLEMLANQNGGDICADELADAAWESENINGVVFYNNCKADRFTIRHGNWVDGAMEYICNLSGMTEHYVEMKADCNDKFLVVAFIHATEHYLYNQLGIDPDKGKLSEKRIQEIIRQIKATEYEGGHWY